MCIDKQGKELSQLPVSQENLKYLINYNPDTGVFTWRVSINPNSKVGSVVATKHQEGYTFLTLNKKIYKLHRLAFLYMLGYYPEEVDHINNKRDDNRWCNLRAASKTENQHNAGLRSDNTSGIKGISKYGLGYKASIQSHKKQYSKCFPLYKYGTQEKSLDAAIDWLRTLRQELHKEFTNHG